MTNDQFRIGFYWGQRQETLTKCTDRVSNFLASIGRIDKLFETWHLRRHDRSKSRVRHSLQWTQQRVEALLVESAVKSDLGEVMPRAGYSLFLWNGYDAHFSANLEIRIAADVKNLKNVCLLSIPVAPEATDRLLRVPVLLQACKLIAKCFEPDHGLVTSEKFEYLVHDFASEHYKSNIEVPDVGWITYLCKRYKLPARLPKKFRVTPVDSLGTLITALDHRFSVDKSGHVEAVKELTSLLDLKCIVEA